jgi:hypothetical protein
MIEENVCLAEEVFEGLEKVSMHQGKVFVQQVIHDLGYDHLLLGTPSILPTGNAAACQTGSWHKELCLICLEQCPRHSIVSKKEVRSW